MSSLPDLEGWAVFARVADTGSFAGAAEELGLSKATVSKVIARLEVRIGAPLFNRTSRRLSLTEMGRASLETAGRLLTDALALEENALSAAIAPRGLVRISVPVSFGLAHVSSLIPELLDLHPGIDIDMRLDDAVVDLVAGGYDMAIRIARLPDSGLRVRRIAPVRLLLAAAPSLLQRQGRPAHPRDLDPVMCLGYGHVGLPGRWRFRREGTAEEHAVQPAGRLRSNNGDALLASARAGHGFVVLPEFMVWQEVQTRQLEPLLTDWSLPSIDLNVVLPPSILRPARIAAVANFLTERLSQSCWIAQERMDQQPAIAS